MFNRIEKMIRILNKIQPDWKNKVNWRKLDLQNHYKCVLGQIFGAYEVGLEAIRRGGFDDSTPWKYGVSFKWDELNEENWIKLHDAWVSILKTIPTPKKKRKRQLLGGRR